MRPSETSEEAIRRREVERVRGGAAGRTEAVRAEQADLVARWERIDELIEIERRYGALEAEVTRLREVVRAWSRILVHEGRLSVNDVREAVGGITGPNGESPGRDAGWPVRPDPLIDELHALEAPWRRFVW